MPVSTEHQSLHAPDSHITPTSESQPTVCTSMRIKLTNWGNYRFHEYNFYKKRAWQKLIWYNSSAWIIWRRCGYLVRRERGITFAAGSWISISWLIELTNKSYRLKTQWYIIRGEVTGAANQTHCINWWPARVKLYKNRTCGSLLVWSIQVCFKTIAHTSQEY